MYKLLTEEEKIKIEGEYKSRRIVLMMLFLVALLLVGSIGLLPSYIIAVSKEQDANSSLAALNQSLSGKTAEDLDIWLKEINTKIKLFAPSQDTDRPYEAFKDIIALKTEGIKINTFSYAKNKTNIEFTLEGLAADRRTLVDFQNNLNSSDKFTSASIPVADLAKDKNIPFNLTLKPKK
jgi:Tfp pilus assembly protein PilN